jgi:hypothetical protein
MASYNFSDPLVSQLVHGSHWPCEIDTGTMIPGLPDPSIPATPLHLEVFCARDYESWPCQTITALRTFENTRTRDKEAADSRVIDPRRG